MTVATDGGVLERGAGRRPGAQAGGRPGDPWRAARLPHPAGAAADVPDDPDAARRGGDRLDPLARARRAVRPGLAGPGLAGLRGHCPTKLVHYTLPAYGAIAWLAAAALAAAHRRARPLDRRGRSAACSACCWPAAGFYLVKLLRRRLRHPGRDARRAAAGRRGRWAAAGCWSGARRRVAVAAAVGLGLVGHAALAAGLAPRLSPLWLSPRSRAGDGEGPAAARAGHRRRARHRQPATPSPAWSSRSAPRPNSPAPRTPPRRSSNTAPPSSRSARRPISAGPGGHTARRPIWWRR